MTAVLILAALVIAAGAAAAWLWRALARERVASALMKGEQARVEAFLGAVPQAYCGWSPSGAAAVSDAFLALLRVEEVKSLADIETALSPSDAAALHGAFARLAETGAGFRLTARTADEGRTLEIVGRTGRSAAGKERFDVIWASDVTESLAIADRSARTMAGAERAQAELRAMLDAVPVPVWLRRGDLGLAVANRAYVRAVGGSLDQVMAEEREIAAGAVAQGGRALGMRARASGQPQTESHHVVIGGERRLIEFTEQPVAEADADGRRLIVGHALDLTPLEEAESELVRHIDAHAEVLEQLKTAIAIFGQDKRLKFFNQAYMSLWGFEEAWLETQPALGELLEDLRTRRRIPEHADFPAFKKGQLDLFTSLLEPQEDLMHLPDGTTLREVVTPHPFGGLLFVLEDVTSALTLERNYNTLMAVQRESLDNMAEGIAVWGSDGRLRLCNPAFLKIWDLAPEDLADEPHIADVIDRTRRYFPGEGGWEEKRAALIADALEREGAGHRLERADGSILEHRTVPLPDGGVLNSYLDVTDSARIEQALRASNEALETADRLKSEFIANVSYQLRTPLNAIMGFAEILNNRYFGSLNDRQADYTRSILDASQRLLALINDILDLATIEAGYMALDRKSVDVHGLLASVFELTREWAAKQNLKVELDSRPQAGAIEADERRLKQALYNLVSNAIKFTPPGGSIVLSSRREGGEVRLAVSDTGIGIPEADQTRVFGRFERAHRQQRQGGVGLGLALVKSFVEMHGGHIELASAPGEGTTVTCVLPVQAPDRAPERAPDRAKAAPVLTAAARTGTAE